VLSGNSAGFTDGPVDISSISTTTYPELRLRAALSTTDPDATPSVDSWSIAYESGPEPLGNIAFSMRGEKVIGSDAGGAPIFKYDESHTTNGSGVLALNDIEEDTYTIAVDGAAIGYDIAESCAPQPRALAPASTMTTFLYFAPHTANSILLNVRGAGGVLIEDAEVRLFRASNNYDVTQSTSGCGQAFFSGLQTGMVTGGNPYSVEVSASGYQTFTSTTVDVSGASTLSVILNVL